MTPSHFLSLSLAKKLHEAGFRIESSFYWYKVDDNTWALGDMTEALNNGKDYANSTALGYGIKYIPAPLASELLDILPATTKIHKGKTGYFANTENVVTGIGYDNPVEALGELALHLIANKLIEVK